MFAGLSMSFSKITGLPNFINESPNSSPNDPAKIPDNTLSPSFSEAICAGCGLVSVFIQQAPGFGSDTLPLSATVWKQRVSITWANNNQPPRSKVQGKRTPARFVRGSPRQEGCAG